MDHRERADSLDLHLHDEASVPHKFKNNFLSLEAMRVMRKQMKEMAVETP